MTKQELDTAMEAAIAETSQILKMMNPHQRSVFNTSLGKALENVPHSEDRYPQIVRILQRLNHESRITNS